MAYQKMAYIDKGSGSPLLLLHAFPLNRCMWDTQLDFLCNRFRVIAPDYHGFGDSPAVESPFTLASLAEDLIGLLSSLGVTKDIALVGLSMGGYIAFELVRRYAEQLRALVLAATHPAPDSEAVRQARYQMAEAIWKEGIAPLAESMIPRLLGKTARETKPELEQKVRNLMLRNQPAGVAHGCLAMASRRDSTDLLENIKFPTLIISGTEDAIIPPMPPTILQQRIAGSKWIAVEKCGHLINLEQPATFSNAVLEFLQSI